MLTNFFVGDKACHYCSTDTCKIYHGGRCPQVKTIEYYPDGTIKKVEFFESSINKLCKHSQNG